MRAPSGVTGDDVGELRDITLSGDEIFMLQLAPCGLLLYNFKIGARRLKERDFKLQKIEHKLSKLTVKNNSV